MMTGYTTSSTAPSGVNWVSTSTNEIGSKNTLTEGIDYYWEEVGGSKYRVFTAKYLYDRDFCCGNDCRHCPYKKEDKE